ncbi:MAG TPA: ABC transporter permease [Blastocatellia bacterium]|nr:ABC transporter permease [Blastocatellia bacterium]
MGNLLQDIRYGFRLLVKSPGFAAVAILSLALGIGANTSIFSVINATLWQTLPYKDPDRLVRVYRTTPDPKFPISAWSYPKYEMLRDRNGVFEEVAAFSNQDFPLTGTDDPERLEVEIVSASYFPLLGVSPALGRTFDYEEDKTPGASPVAVISHSLWQRRFNADRGVLGQPISLNKVPFTVIGVLPEGFKGQSDDAEVWVPMMMAPSLTFPRRLATAGAHWHEVIARIRPGVSDSEALAAMGVVGNDIQETISKRFSPDPEMLTLVHLKEARIDPVMRKSFLILFAAIGFVLLIACVNIANLLMARSTARQKEMAIRLAIGASRARLVRQLLTESVVLALMGGLLGLLVTLWGIEVLTAFKPEGLITWQKLDFESAGIDGQVLAFSLSLSLFTGLLFGLMPALQASRSEINESLKEGAGGAALKPRGLRRLNARNVLVVAEIAIALVLLISAGLMLKSFSRLQAIRTGFDPSNTLTLKADLPKYKPEAAAAFYEQLLARINTLPGVQSATVATSTPLSGNSSGTIMTIEGRPPLDEPGVGLHSVAPDHFRTLGVPLLRGRAFTEQDRAGARRVSIISETAASRFFPGEDPIGKRIKLAVGWQPEDDMAEIVGIVGDVKYGKVEEEPKPDVYLSYLQPTENTAFVIVRTKAEPSSIVGAVRKEVLALDKNVPLYDIRPMEDRIAAATSRTRFTALILGIFAGLALVLAAIGIYGVMYYVVSSRIHEIGIRMALGAKQSDVLKLLMSDAVLLTVAGLALGLAAAYAITRLLASQLYEVSSTDASTFALISSLLAAVALVACYIPIRKAMNVDPVVALRYE